MNLLTGYIDDDFAPVIITANNNDVLLKLIDNTYDLECLNQIKIYLENVLHGETELYTNIREQWVIDVTKVKLQYCNNRIKHLQEEKEVISATI